MCAVMALTRTTVHPIGAEELGDSTVTRRKGNNVPFLRSLSVHGR
jgi:hypothetical protein